MKIIIAVMLLSVLLLTSCGATTESSTTQPVVTDPNVEKEVVFFEQLSGHRAGGTTADEIGDIKDRYIFKTNDFAGFVEKGITRTDSFYGHTIEMECYALKENIGCDYREKYYEGEDVSFIVTYHEDTDKLVGISAFHLEKPILQAEGLTTEQDFINYAKTIAKDFINVEEYVVEVVHKEAPKPGTANAYRGDEYVFKKQISGVDTAECLVVAITPDGAVGEIQHKAVDQFEDFEGITLDSSMIGDAVEQALSAALPQTNGKVEIEEYDYYLMNDGGTLLLYLELSSTSTPIDEEKTTDPANPVYREEDTVHIGTVAVVPIAKVKK